jgi:hypothetical protein
MRKPLILGLFVLGFGFSVSAQQHAAVAVPSPAPAVAAHPAPAGQAAPHAATGHTTTSAHPVHRVSASSNVKTAVPHSKAPATMATHPLPPPPLGGAVNPLGGFVNSVTGATSSCNRRGSYQLPGLNACAPTTGVVLPFFGGGIYVPVPYYVDSSAPQEQPEDQQEEASNQPLTDSNVSPMDQGQGSFNGAPPPPTPRSSSNGINESLAQFVFVQRDGTKLYAVAYSFLNDKLHYVTKDGARRSVALDSLDFDATQKSNEDLGNTVNLPSLPSSGVALNLVPATLQ